MTLHSKTLLSAATLCGVLLAGAHGQRARAATIAEVEAAIPGGVFLEFNLDTDADANGGVTAAYTHGAGDWGFPDSSNSGQLVNGSGLDDKGNAADEIQADYSGLAPNEDYYLWVVAVQNVGSTAESHDFEWGLSSGGLTTVTGGTPGTLATSDAGYDGAHAVNVLNTVKIQDSGSDELIGVLVGQVSTDAAGALTVYFDNGIDAVTSGGNDFRSQLDGVVFTQVPEPTSLALLGLVAAPAAVRRRRRSAVHPVGPHAGSGQSLPACVFPWSASANASGAPPVAESRIRPVFRCGSGARPSRVSH